MDDKNSNTQSTTEKNKIELENSNDSTTITPSAIDNSSEMLEKKRDISAIIPKFEEEDNSANKVELISKDNELKSDGSVSLGTINSEGEININAGVILPEQIDIEKRKIEAQKRKNQGKKKKKKKMSITAQKIQNSTALVALVLIVGLAGVIYFIFNHPTEEDFMPINLTIELGDKLPIRTSSYVKPGVGKEVDELLYALDLSKVNISEPGTYDFTVTDNNIEKTGKITIKDTKAPELEVRELIISQGTSYGAASFVESCSDPSGCNYSFQDSATTEKYNTPGSYVVYVVASDAFNNSTTKQASLIIEAEGTLRTYVRKVLYNNNSFDTANMIIKYTQTNLTNIGSNYSRLTDVENYLIREGFSYIS